MKKKFGKYIHVWKIEGFVNIEKKFKESIKNQLLLKYGSYQKTSSIIGKITGMHLSYFLRKENSFISINKLFRLTNALKIPNNVVERKIIKYRDHGAQQSFLIRFPFKINPLIIRVIAHIPGDGNIRKDGFARWIQKDTRPMKILLKKLGFPIKISKSRFVCIPRFLVKVICVSLDLQPVDLNSSKLIETVMKLPRRYQVQTILALIEDEATIDVRGYGVINIRLANKDLIMAYAKLCDSLGYKRSDVIKKANSGFGKGTIIYQFGVLADGIRKLGIDYNKTVKKYSKPGGLWKKDNAFKQRYRKALSPRALKCNEWRKITKKVLKLFEKHEELSVKKICDLMNTDDYSRVYEKVKYLYKTARIKRVGYGKYALIYYF